MVSAYQQIVEENLKTFFKNPDGKTTEFRAFGKPCLLRPEGIYLDGKTQEGVLGILISLYALHAGPEELVLEPLKAFKELPDSAPYVAAFAARTQQVLVPSVERIEQNQERILDAFSGVPSPPSAGGDFSFVLYPFPKIALCYIFYRADEDFPPSVTCLFSHNAPAFAPVDALADTAEYTSRAILENLRQAHGFP